MTEPAILQEVRDETTQEDTIELELTPDDVISLSRAAAVEQDSKRSDTVAARLPSPPSMFHEANAHETICNLTGRRPARRSIGVVASTMAIVVLGSAAYRVMSPRVLQPRRADDALASPRQSEPELPQHQRPNVRFTNPFDSSEVFEFPAGTSEAEANELVANILLQRARDRRPK